MLNPIRKVMKMTVSELIHALEDLPPDCPVIVNDAEVTDIVVREEIYFCADNCYAEDTIVKLY